MNLIWSLFIPQPFFSLFAPSYYRRHLLKGQTLTVQTVQELGERRQCRLISTDSVYRRLKKKRLARKPDDNTEHRVYHSTRTKLFLCEKKSKQNKKRSILWSDSRTECRTSRVVVGWVDRPTCYILGHA